MILNNDAWSPSWIRGSKLDEIVWIAKDVLAWCTGINIVFFNIKEKKLSFRWCWNSDSGEGARCLSGHTRFPIFAFAEKMMQPRILVISYPSMTKVSECTGGCPSGYLATAFTAQDYMVSVGFYPHFAMIVWNWRTGEKIISVNTEIRDEVGQILRITQVGPTVIGQMGRTCGTMFTWELSIAGNVAVLKGKNRIFQPSLIFTFPRVVTCLKTFQTTKCSFLVTKRSRGLTGVQLLANLC